MSFEFEFAEQIHALLQELVIQNHILSAEQILREIEDECSKETPDHDKIRMLTAKYDAFCRSH